MKNRILDASNPADEKLLRKKTKRVKNPQSTEVIILGQTMSKICQHPGVAGVAAPQLGVPLRMFCLSCMGNDKAPTFFLNPRIVSYGEATESKNEGCLSVPNKIGSVERSTEVLLSWYDHNNKRYEYKFDGFWAQAVQHEMDHLEGTLYIDKATEVHTEEEMRAKWEAAQEITKMSSEELEKEVISDMQSPLVELEKNQ